MRAPPLFLILATASTLGAAAEPAFHYDRQQAIERAAALVREEIEKHPAAAIPGVAYGNPQIDEVRARSGRRFVVVTFRSALADWGEYVMFELCGTALRTVPSGTGKTIDIVHFREVVTKIGTARQLALPNACGAGSV